MEDNKKETKEQKTPIGTLILMAIGFIVGGITTAATASEIPNAVRTVGEKLARAVPEEKEKSTEITE
jgi:hypothetical protein